ncbi:hypothetical protein AWB91_08960 [Mycobacterium paraense]|uniref:Uncharacterized protein n=1 Tax=Mycobacterium paraense TaxID=767916 RepID=A0ABX3VTA8_9MYCO|nr:hypothetical protein [Mycobacterium paraense]ORW33246.1 hypothetical protein AWB91_08960 [Mycobacterium paraense]ORW34694.1 hypothetical protein AWB88_02820 [Mycobacterium paraense]
MTEPQAPKWDGSFWVIGAYMTYALGFLWWEYAPGQPVEAMPLTGDQFEAFMFWGNDIPEMAALLIAVAVSNWRARRCAIA